MGYTKEIETRIIRTEHCIDFVLGSTAFDIMNCMKEVPSNAKVIEVEEIGTDRIYIRFSEDRQE